MLRGYLAEELDAHQPDLHLVIVRPERLDRVLYGIGLSLVLEVIVNLLDDIIVDILLYEIIEVQLQS